MLLCRRGGSGRQSAVKTAKARTKVDELDRAHGVDHPNILQTNLQCIRQAPELAPYDNPYG